MTPQKLDEILFIYYSLNKPINRIEVSNAIHEKGKIIDTHELRILIRRLNKDGLIEPLFTGSEMSMITLKGVNFYNAGGYVGYEIRRVEKTMRRKEIEDLHKQQIKSNLDTNNSVLKTNEIQQKVLWLTLGVSALTLLVTTINTCKTTTMNVGPLPLPIQLSTQHKDSNLRQIQKLQVQKVKVSNSGKVSPSIFK